MKAPQGQSWATENKIRGVAGLIEINLKLVIRIRQKFARLGRAPYFHFDLNAGSGWNDRVPSPEGIMGTPLVFLEAVARTGFTNVSAFFVDQDSAATEALASRPELSGLDWVEVVNEENSGFCDQVPALMEGRAGGSLE